MPSDYIRYNMHVEIRSAGKLEVACIMLLLELQDLMPLLRCERCVFWVGTCNSERIGFHDLSTLD